MRRSVLIVDDHAAFRSAARELLCSGRQGNKAHTEGSQIEGRWKFTWTRTELVHAGLAPSDAAKLAGPGSIQFKDGRLVTPGGLTGRYRIRRGHDHARFRSSGCAGGSAG